MKLIPFSSLGNDNGLLIGFKPDYIKIYSEEEYIRNDVLVGIYDGKLSKNNLYTSLIGLDILSSQKGKNMNLLKRLKGKIIKILGKYLYKDNTEKFPVFYIRGNQTLPPPLDIIEEENFCKNLC